MSRIGKQPVKIPSGVKASVTAGQVLIEGPGGKLSCSVAPGITVAQSEGQLLVTMIDEKDRRRAKALKAAYGTARALLNNMVLGVTKGWKKSLEMNGVGFTASLKGQELVIAAGYSHDVTIMIPKEVKCNVTKTTIDLQSADRQLLGGLAARIRKVHKPEPYLGKGIKYSDEKIRRKAGKTGKK